MPPVIGAADHRRQMREGGARAGRRQMQQLAAAARIERRDRGQHGQRGVERRGFRARAVAAVLDQQPQPGPPDRGLVRHLELGATAVARQPLEPRAPPCCPRLAGQAPEALAAGTPEVAAPGIVILRSGPRRRHAGNQRRFAGAFHRGEAGCHRVRIRPVDALHGPATGGKAAQQLALLPVIALRRLGEDHAQPVEPELARERGGFLAHTGGELARRRQHPAAVVHERAPEPGRHHAFGQGQAHGGGDPLARQPRGRLDRRMRARVGEHLDGPHPAELEQCVVQRGECPVRHHEPVAVGPARVGGVEAERAAPEAGEDTDQAASRRGRDRGPRSQARGEQALATAVDPARPLCRRPAAIRRFPAHPVMRLTRASVRHPPPM